MLSISFPRLNLAMAGAFAAVLLAAPTSRAQNLGTTADAFLLTDLLPQGRHAFRIESRRGYADQYLTPNGDRAPLFGAADGLALDAGTIPLLAALGAGATLGNTHLQARATGTRHRLVFGHGMNPDLTVGLMLPWGRIDNRLTFSVAGSNLGANPLFNPALPIGIANVPLAPLALLPPGTPATGTEEVQQVLSNPIYGYNYKRVGSVHHEGLLDPVIGARWRIASDRNSATILAPALRIGMAEKRDPDQLFDMRLEEGTTDVILGVEHLRNLPDDFDLGLSGKATLRTSDKIMARARGVGEFVVPQSRTEKLDRRLGHIFEGAAEIGSRSGDWRLFGRLDYSYKGKDRYRSPRGQDVSGLEADTLARSMTGWLGATWSGLRAYEAGRLPMPLFFSIQYRHAFWGHNDILTRDWYLTLTSVF